MTITQISVFVENKPGKLVEVTEILGSHNIDIRALCIADTAEFGILRMIVDNPRAAAQYLSEADFIVSPTDVIAVPIDDRSGGLGKVLRIMTDAGISIEYCYAFVSRRVNTAYVIFRVEDADAACAALTENGIVPAGSDELYGL